MMKKFKYAVVFLLGAAVSLGVFAITKASAWTHHPVSIGDVARAADTSTTKSPTGFPMTGGVLRPFVPPLRTKEDFVTRGNADDKLEIASLFYTYIWYHDSHNGAGVASLFSDDGILEILWNNGGKTVEPNGGPNGKGCLEHGHQQISDFFGTNPIPFVGHSHNQVSNVNVQVRGDIGTLYANWTTIHSNDDKPVPGAVAPNTAVVSHNGEYVGDARRTSDGWRFANLWILEDEPHMKMANAVCEQNVTGNQ
jgi:hypothetical protein